MALVEYGSSDSEQEEPNPSPPPKSKTINSSKPAFEKLVDKSNPGKVRVNLVPESSKAAQEDATDESEPPAKRTKTGTFGGFNSFLPAPKRTTGTAGGLGKGVNLKTGAAPGFTREPMPETPSHNLSHDGSHEVAVDDDTATTATSTNDKSTVTSDGTLEKSTNGVSKKKSTMFKPLSVARKPKKRAGRPEGQNPAASTSKADMAAPKPAPKASLFSVGDVSDTLSTASSATGTYQPLVYHAESREDSHLTSNPTWDQQTSLEASVPQPTSVSSSQGDSLDSIAADLNLTSSARRQLLGRNQRDSKNSSIKITNFNTDQEYAANEILRQSGEIVQHNAVRGVAPGKHSLKQLVNAATTQKDALEEQFAAGRRNKSEAGAKYGW